MISYLIHVTPKGSIIGNHLECCCTMALCYPIQSEIEKQGTKKNPPIIIYSICIHQGVNK